MEHVRMHRTLDACNPEKKKTIEKKIKKSLKRLQNKITVVEISFFNVILPNLFSWPDDFRKSIEKSLIDSDMLVDLEQSKVINWCRSAVTLYPLNTWRDGNCLLHAVSTFIWGVQDTALTLRQVLLNTLLDDTDDKFKRRYVINRRNQLWNDLIDDDSINTEWSQIIESTTPKVNANLANPHIYLEPIHVFILANIIRRPIIVLSVDKLRSVVDAMSIQENEMGGIYLPLEFKSSQCDKSPVILGYCLSHFTPLVISKKTLSSSQKLAIPLQTKDYTQLPLKFLNSEEEHNVLNLTNEYLHLVDLVCSMEGSIVPISGAKLSMTTLPQDMNLIDDYVVESERIYRQFLDSEAANSFGNTPIIHPHASENLTPTQIPANLIQGQAPANFRPGSETHVEQPGAQAFSQRPPAAKTRYFGIHEGNPSPETMHYFQNRKCQTVGCQMYGSAATGHMCSSCLLKYTQANAGPPSFHAEPTAPPPSIPIAESFRHDSMLDQECITVGCRFKCSKATRPYCHECENKSPLRQISKNSSNTEEKRRLSAEMERPIIIGSLPKGSVETPSSCGEAELYGAGAVRPEIIENSANWGQLSFLEHLENEEKQPRTTSHQHGGNSSELHRFAERNQKAPVQECIHTTGSLGGKCNQCNLSIPKKNSTIPREVIPGSQTHQNSNACLSAHVRSEKYLCSTPGCPGIRMKNNNFEMCYSCAEKNSVIRQASGETTRTEPVYPKPLQTSQGIQEIGNQKGTIEDNLEESGTPSDAIIEPIQSTCNDENVKCASPMCDNLVAPPEKLCQECLDVLRKNQAKISKKESKCKTSGCEFHGHEKFNGFCSECYKKKVQKVHSAPVAQRNQYQVEQQLMEKSNTAPYARNRTGQKCIIGYCTRYGEPTTGNMCMRCFLKTNPQNPPSTLVSSPQLTRCNERLQLVENSQKIRIRCKSKNCNNYGNSNCEGFCNGCYQNYRRHFPRPSKPFGEEMIG